MMTGGLKRCLCALAVGASSLLPTMAGELVLAENSQANCQIVIPDRIADEDIATSITRAAELVRRMFFENAMDVRIVAESKADKGKPGIFLGGTELAAGEGITPAAMSGWSYAYKITGKHLIIAGHDRLGRLKGNGSKRRHLSWYGTLKGTTDFLRDYAGVRFLTPGDDGIEFLPQARIAVPDDLDIRKRPYMDANDFWGNKDDVFFTAHGLVPFQNMNDHFGHSHPVAVPVDEYWQSHPEYFALINGVRACHIKGSEGGRLPQLCLSNREVQELIYQRILKDLDEGNEIAEVGQCDGFKPCECEGCINLYGIKPTADRTNGRAWINDPAWPEKLWIMHRGMAERLKQDRPGKRMMILAYSVAAMPPRTFDTFPGNVVIEMARYTPAHFDAWRAMKGIEGFATYVYNWGTYQLTSYMPIRSPGFIEDQVHLFVTNRVRTIRTHGFGQNDGLEGPSQYVYLRMLDEPLANPAAAPLVEEYIQAAFGAAADPMRRFFATLHARLEFNRYLTKDATDKNPLFVINALFTPDLLDELGAQLASAEKKVKSGRPQRRLAMIRGELEYLRLTANAARTYYNYLALKDPASLDMAIAAVEARNRWFDNLPLAGTNAKGSARIAPSAPAFKGVGREGVRLPKFLNTAPFNWDTAKMRSGQALPPTPRRLAIAKVEGPVTLSSALWDKAAVHSMEDAVGATNGMGTRFKILYDSRNLYVYSEAGIPETAGTLNARGRDAELWLQEAIDICLSPEADREMFYHLVFEPLPDSFYDAAHGFITDTLDPLFGKDDTTWNPDWRYENQYAPARRKWIAMATIPFASLGVDAPAKGDIWLGNFGRVHVDDTGRKHALWSGRGLARQSFSGAGFGELVFE